MARRSSLAIAVVGACALLASRSMLPASFCGGSPLPSGRVAARAGHRAVAARAEPEATLAAEAKAPEVSAPLRLASGVTGMLTPVLQAQAKFAAGDYDKDEIRGLIEAESKSAPLVMYTLSQSPFSIEAKRLLEESSIEYKEIEIAPLFIQAEGDNAARRAELGEMTGRTSMPHIFINGESIGGLYDGTPGLAALIESGELEAMVRPAKEEGPLDALFSMFQ